jgi:hypothetical protein
VALSGETRNAYRILVVKPEGQRPGTSSIRLSKLLKQMEVDWINLGQGRDKWRALMNTVISSRESYSAENVLNNSKTISFSRTALLRGVRYTYIYRRLYFHEVTYVNI